MMKPTSSKSVLRVARFLRKILASIKSNICFGDYHNITNNTPLLSSFSCSRRGSPGDSQSVIYCESKAVAETIHESPNKNQHKKKEQRVIAEPFEEAKQRGVMLAQKMKDLNMVDLRDAEHALDVREALRCYSNIRSPVYLDIVDNFFTDMYYEFSDPHTSSGINGSRRKASSFRL